MVLTKHRIANIDSLVRSWKRVIMEHSSILKVIQLFGGTLTYSITRIVNKIILKEMLFKYIEKY